MPETTVTYPTTHIRWVQTNADVINAWANGQAGRTRNLSTDGQTLWSYRACIGRYYDGYPVVARCYLSSTTSKHMGLARQRAKASIEVEKVWNQNNYWIGHRYTTVWPAYVRVTEDFIEYATYYQRSKQWKIHHIPCDQSFKWTPSHERGYRASTGSNIWNAFRKLCQVAG